MTEKHLVQFWLVVALQGLLGMTSEAGAQSGSKEWKKLTVVPATLEPTDGLLSFMDGFETRVSDGDHRVWGHLVSLKLDGVYLDGKNIGDLSSLAKKKDIRIDDDVESSIRFVDRGSYYAWHSVSGVRLKLGKSWYYIIDCDADGLTGELGEDMLLGPNSSVGSPWTGEIWSEGGAWRLRREPDGDGWQYSCVSSSEPNQVHLWDAWCYLQTWRQAAGLPPFLWSDELYPGCIAHIKYVTLNEDHRGHFEDPGRPGYSKEGAIAASCSAIGYGKKSAVEGIQKQFRTAFHLESVLNSVDSRAAIAYGDGVFMLRTMVDGELEETRDPVVFLWPPPGARLLPTTFGPGGENPMPVPGRSHELELEIGQVIVAKVTGDGPYTVDVRANGKPIVGYLTLPGFTIGDFSNESLAVFAPARPLPSRAWIDATLFLGEGTERVVWSWRFQTR